MHDKFKHTSDGYQTEDSTTSLPSLCQICDHPGANCTCANHPCTHTAHAACCQQDWTYRECTHPASFPALPPAIVTALLASPLTYTASEIGFHISPPRPTDYTSPLTYTASTKTHTSPPRHTDSTSPTSHIHSHTKDTFQSCPSRHLLSEPNSRAS
jgi:hypothetical protein